MVALAALSGYLAAPAPHALRSGAQLFCGVLLLSAAASAFNQAQERSLDRLLPRTSQRPLASGRMQVHHAVWLAILLVSVGTFLIANFSLAGGGIGLFALVWYNLIYTPLKSRTSLVLLVGALGGALPPLLGWVSSGASAVAPKAIHLYLLLMLWQVPHFWCLAMRDDLRGQQIGLKMVPGGWDQRRVLRMIRLWSVAFGTLLLLSLPLGFLNSLTGKLAMTLIGVWCIGSVTGRSAPRNSRQWAITTGTTLHLALAGALATIVLDPILGY